MRAVTCQPPPPPPQSGPFCSHSAADAPPLAALTDAKLCSGDKRGNGSAHARLIVMHRHCCSHLAY